MDMADPKTDERDKGDEVLRRLLKTPPDPKTGKGEKPKDEKDEKKDR